jgi:hypothetical protein
VGLVTSPKQPEIVYTCYSGSVKSVCDRKAAKKLGTTVDETALEQQVQQTPLPGEEKKQKINKITELQQQVDRLKQLKEVEEQKIE